MERAYHIQQKLGVFVNVWPMEWDPSSAYRKECALNELKRMRRSEPQSEFRLISYRVNDEGYCIGESEEIEEIEA